MATRRRDPPTGPALLWRDHGPSGGVAAPGQDRDEDTSPLGVRESIAAWGRHYEGGDEEEGDGAAYTRRGSSGRRSGSPPAWDGVELTPREPKLRTEDEGRGSSAVPSAGPSLARPALEEMLDAPTTRSPSSDGSPHVSPDPPAAAARAALPSCGSASAEAENLGRQREQLRAEQALAAAERAALESLLTRSRARPQAGCEAAARSGPHGPRETVDPSAEEGVDRNGSRAPSPSTDAVAAATVASLSPIHRLSYGDPSREGTPSPRGTRAAPASPSPLRPTPAPVTVPGVTGDALVDSDARGMSTAIVREVCSVSLAPLQGRQDASSSSGKDTMASRTRSTTRGTSIRAPAYPPVEERQVVTAGASFAEKLQDLARLRRLGGAAQSHAAYEDAAADDRSGLASSWRARANGGTSPAALAIFARRGCLLTPSPMSVASAARRTFQGPLVEQRPRLCWDVARSGNVLVSADGGSCLADGERAWQVAMAEYGVEDRGPYRVDVAHGAPSVPELIIPMYGLGTVGVAVGDFVFQVRLHREYGPPAMVGPSIAGGGLRFDYAVGVTTQRFRGAESAAAAFLYASDGSLLAGSGREILEDGETASAAPVTAYGVPFTAGDEVTVVLRLSEGLLAFFHNGRDMGPAFRLLPAAHPEPLFPLVLFGSSGHSATFVRPFFA